MSLGLMVAVILLQVFQRYVMNNALSWPDEFARFLMLWMAGLVAPSAYRVGGFVAIDTLPSALSKMPSLVLMLGILLLSTAVLGVAIHFGWAHTMGFGGKFDSSSMRVPLDWFGMESIRIKLRYMYGSLLTCVILLFSVNVELILRIIVDIFRPGAILPTDKQIDTSVALTGGD